MNIEVIPIAITSVDLTTYIREVRPGPKLDPFYIDPNSLLGFLSSMVRDGDPRNAIRNVNHLLRHLSVSFLIKANEKDAHELKFFTNLVVSLVGEDMFLVAGTLEEWKIAIIDLCNPSSTMKTRYIFNCCLLYIEKAGLIEVFGNYSKQTQPDQTFILQRKE